MRALAWLNGDDFDKAMELARARFPAPPRKNLPLVESVLELIQPASAEAPGVVAPTGEGGPPGGPAAIDAPAPAIELSAFRVERASARFLPQWRVRS